MMGIIPRNPSPERPTNNDETAVPDDAVQQEVQDLRVSPLSVPVSSMEDLLNQPAGSPRPPRTWPRRQTRILERGHSKPQTGA